MLTVLVLSGCKKDEMEEPVSLIKKVNVTLLERMKCPQ